MRVCHIAKILVLFAVFSVGWKTVLSRVWRNGRRACLRSMCPSDVEVQVLSPAQPRIRKLAGL